MGVNVNELSVSVFLWPVDIPSCIDHVNEHGCYIKVRSTLLLGSALESRVKGSILFVCYTGFLKTRIEE